MLRLAAQAWADGAAVDPALALPLYVRDHVAQTTAEREAARTKKDPSGGRPSLSEGRDRSGDGAILSSEARGAAQPQR
jgi:hypothetical protein